MQRDSRPTPYRCPECHFSEFSDGAEQLTCNHCRRGYGSTFGIVDFIPIPNHHVVHELEGLAAENGIALGSDLQPVKFLRVPAVESVKVLMGRSRHERTQYYQQTAAAYFEALSRAKLDAGLRVLEIGSERTHFKLHAIRDLCDEAYALNIFFLISTENESIDWPHRVLGDMNDLPFADGCMDLVICSATLHHTSTLTLAISEIARVLRPGGRAVVINEPVEGAIKSLGLSRGAKRHDRHEDIHEDPVTYRGWRKAIKGSGLRADHFLPAWLIEQVAAADMLPEGVRFGGLARRLAPALRITAVQELVRTFGRVPGQALLGLPLNVVLWKD